MRLFVSLVLVPQKLVAKKKKTSCSNVYDYEIRSKQLNNYLAKQKRKVKDKELVLLTDKKTDQELTAASSNGRYDEVFLKLLQKNLQSIKITRSTIWQCWLKGKKVIKQSNDNVTPFLKITLELLNDWKRKFHHTPMDRYADEH